MKLGVVVVTVLCVLVLVAIAGGWGTAAHAQSVAPSASSPMAQPGLTGVTDIFIGRNTKGPYMLSWKNIEPNSDVAVCDGITLARSSDYNIDYATGMLALTSPLASNKIVRVTYGYKPEKAAANTPGMTLPISLDLMNREGSKLQMLGLYKEQDPNRPDSGKTIFGLGGTTKRDSTEITTTLLTTTQAGEGEDDAASLWERSGVKLGAKTTAADGRLNLSGSYMRAGEQFAGEKEYGLKTGYESYDLGAALRATDGVRASFSLRRTEDVSGFAKGASVESQQQQVVFGTDNSPKITATRAAEETVTAEGVTANAAVTETLAVEQSFGPSASVSASKETKAVTSGDSTSSTDTMNVAINVAPVKNVRVSGSRTMVDSDANGNLTTTDLSVAAKPVEQVTVSARYLGQDSVNGEEASRQLSVETQPLGTVNARILGSYSDRISDTSPSTTKEARVEMSPVQGATLGGGLRLMEDGATTTTVTDVSGRIKPADYLELSAAYKNRESTGAEDVESKAVRVALAPARRLKLTGSYETNPEDSYGVVQQLESKAVGLETRIGSLRLSGSYALKDEYMLGRQAYERRFGADIPLFGRGRLTTGFRESESFLEGQESSTTYSLGYKHDMGSRFTFSLTGYLTQYERDQALLDDQTEYMAETKLGVRF